MLGVQIGFGSFGGLVQGSVDSKSVDRNRLDHELVLKPPQRPNLIPKPNTKSYVIPPTAYASATNTVCKPEIMQ